MIKKGWHKFSRAISLILSLSMILSCSVIIYAEEPEKKFFGTEESSEYIVVLEDPKPVLMFGANTANTEEKKIQKQIEKAYGVMDKLGIEAEVYCEYKNIFTGFAAKLSSKDAEKLSENDIVKAIYPVTYYNLPDAEIMNEFAKEAVRAVELYDEGIGLKGSGVVVAVIDTGIATEHEAFDVSDGMLENPALTRADVEQFISKVGYGTYYSDKILFGYNYGDRNEHVEDTQGHGSHVSGTINALAPDVQFLSLKVFPDGEEGAADYDIFCALDDAMELGADIINMSLGSPNGFTYDNSLETELFGNIFKRLEDAGIILCVAAGNENNMAEYSSNFAAQYGYPFVTSDYSDYGVIGSPSTYEGSMSIASAENIALQGYALEIYRDDDSSYTEAYFVGSDGKYIFDILGTEPAVINLVDCGKAFVNDETNDFEGKNLEGKIALIERGTTTFVEKIDNAVSCGAIAAIIYNNVSGIFTTSVDVPIPFITVSREIGLALKQLFAGGESEAQVKIAFKDEETPVGKLQGNTNAGKMSSFTSWGCTPDLRLKPYLTGIGGNVLSAKAGTMDEYVLMSGTSMATPVVAGCMALLLEKLRDRYPDEPKKDIADLAESIIKSTTNIIIDDEENNIPYSPRRQGTGLVDIARAVNVADKGGVYIKDAIMNLYDEEDGSFEWTFTLVGLSSRLGVRIVPTVLMDELVRIDYDAEPYYYNTLHSLELGSNEYSFSSYIGRIDSNGECVVTCHLKLSNSVMGKLNWLKANGYSYGQFIEGFVQVKPLFRRNELCHGAFMGYVGDWTEAPIFEAYDIMEDGLFEVNTDYNFAALINLESGKGYYAFNNPSINNENPDGLNALYMIPMRLRNSRHTYVVISDFDTGMVYDVVHTQYDLKSVYSEESIPHWRSTAYVFNGTYTNGDLLPNNTKVLISYYANVDYGEDELGQYVRENGAKQLLGDDSMLKYLQWVYPCVIDNEKPVISAEYNASSGTVNIEASDNNMLAELMLVSETSGVLADYDCQTTSVSISYPGLKAGTYSVAVRDSAYNESDIVVTVPGESGSGSEPGYVPSEDPTPYYPSSRPGKTIEPEPKADAKDEALPFTDVTSSAWYYDDVKYVFGKDYMKGIGGDLFGPDVDMTRGMLITILYRMAGSPKASGNVDYPDVYSGQYYSDAVVWAVKNGIANGYGTGLFGPDDNINREDAVTLFYRYAKYKDMDISGRADLSNFADISLANSYAVDALSWAKEAGLVNGTGENTISPKKLITRSEMAALIHRLDIKK